MVARSMRTTRRSTGGQAPRKQLATWVTGKKIPKALSRIRDTWEYKRADKAIRGHNITFRTREQEALLRKFKNDFRLEQIAREARSRQLPTHPINQSGQPQEIRAADRTPPVYGTQDRFIL